ncbi:hypothetical protein AB3S75_006015 [Citrus x aurantiifolia]
MAIIPRSSSSLDLTISVPGFSSSDDGDHHHHQQQAGGSAMKDLDINQVPSEDTEWNNWNTATATTTGSGSMDDEEESCINVDGGPPRKKLRLSKEQSRLLEESFRHNHTLNPKQKEELATQLKLKPRQVEVWFQNRRARSKLKQTEMECEYLKRWFGSLTEQNRRLQREVEELRAMKVGPPTVISPHSCEPLPASTLSMCPRCERVTTTAIDKGPTKVTTASSTTAALSPKVGTPALQSR